MRGFVSSLDGPAPSETAAQGFTGAQMLAIWIWQRAAWFEPISKFDELWLGFQALFAAVSLIAIALLIQGIRHK